MKIAVFGTGEVGTTISSKLVDLGHDVFMGSRTRDNEMAKEFVSQHKTRAQFGTFKDAASFGEIIFNCTLGVGSIAALKKAGIKNLNGKIIVDVANPLDFSKGIPPSLAIVNTDSLAEEIQHTFPETRVVKTLNTIWNKLMVNPSLVNGGDHNVFICGNDNDAKDTVKHLLRSFGWWDNNIVDLGDIKNARATEMYLPLWLSIFMTRNNAGFNIKIVT